MWKSAIKPDFHNDTKQPITKTGQNNPVKNGTEKPIKIAAFHNQSK